MTKQISLPPTPLVEVRCCCDAHLVGWLPLVGFPEQGRVYHYPVLRRATVADLLAHRTPDTLVEVSLGFECAPCIDTASGVVALALQSRDYPIAQLRRIAGFIEA